MLERNSFVTTNKLESSLDKTFVATNEFTEVNKTVNSAVATAEIVDDSEIRQLQLANLPNCWGLIINYPKYRHKFSNNSVIIRNFGL